MAHFDGKPPQRASCAGVKNFSGKTEKPPKGAELGGGIATQDVPNAIGEGRRAHLDDLSKAVL